MMSYHIYDIIYNTIVEIEGYLFGIAGNMILSSYLVVWCDHHAGTRLVADITCFRAGVRYATEMPGILEGHFGSLVCFVVGYWEYRSGMEGDGVYLSGVM